MALASSNEITYMALKGSTSRTKTIKGEKPGHLCGKENHRLELERRRKETSKKSSGGADG